MGNLIETRNLCKKYGTILRVKNLDMKVPEGTVYGFLGPNGAGKTTTMKMILGLARPTSGSISVFGRPANGKKRMELLKHIGSLIESPSYYGHLTGEENLRIMQTLRDIPEKHIHEVLQIVRLQGQKDKKVNQYSMGMKQRLGLACALLGYPKLLILDEPTNGLDPAGIQEMRELIRALPREYGMTVLVSSHLLSEIDQMADTVGIICEGALVFQDTLTNLHARSQHSVAIRTSNNVSTVGYLQEKGIPCKTADGYLLLPDLEDTVVAELCQGIVQNHIGLFRVEKQEKSLEDIFLDLTGKAASL